MEPAVGHAPNQAENRPSIPGDITSLSKARPWVSETRLQLSESGSRSSEIAARISQMKAKTSEIIAKASEVASKLSTATTSQTSEKEVNTFQGRQEYVTNFSCCNILLHQAYSFFFSKNTCFLLTQTAYESQFRFVAETATLLNFS